MRATHHKKYLQLANRLALTGISRNAGGPFGAVIVKNNKIIGRGFNEVLRRSDPTAHAEIIAIQRAAKKLKNFNLKNCEIYAVGEPCPMCLAAIYWARLKKIYFLNTNLETAKIDFDDSLFYQELKKPARFRKIKTQQIKIPNRLEAFEIWKNKKDKIKY